MIESKNNKVTVKGTGEELTEDLYQIACAMLETGMPPLMLTLLTYKAIRESDKGDVLESQIEEIAENIEEGENLYNDLMAMYERGESDVKRS